VEQVAYSRQNSFRVLMRWVERCLCGAIRHGPWEQFRGGQEEHGSGIADIHRSCSPRPQNGSLNTRR